MASKNIKIKRRTSIGIDLLNPETLVSQIKISEGVDLSGQASYLLGTLGLPTVSPKFIKVQPNGQMSYGNTPDFFEGHALVHNEAISNFASDQVEFPDLNLQWFLDHKVPLTNGKIASQYWPIWTKGAMRYAGSVNLTGETPVGLDVIRQSIVLEATSDLDVGNFIIVNTPGRIINVDNHTFIGSDEAELLMWADKNISLNSLANELSIAELPSPYNVIPSNRIFGTLAELLDSEIGANGDHALLTGYKWVEVSQSVYNAAGLKLTRTQALGEPTTALHVTSILLPHFNLYDYGYSDLCLLFNNTGQNVTYWQLQQSELNFTQGPKVFHTYPGAYLETGDWIILAKYEVISTVEHFTFALVNEVYEPTIGTKYGTVMLSDPTSKTRRQDLSSTASNQRVVTEGLLKNVLKNIELAKEFDCTVTPNRVIPTGISSNLNESNTIQGYLNEIVFVADNGKVYQCTAIDMLYTWTKVGLVNGFSSGFYQNTFYFVTGTNQLFTPEGSNPTSTNLIIIDVMENDIIFQE